MIFMISCTTLSKRPSLSLYVNSLSSLTRLLGTHLGAKCGLSLLLATRFLLAGLLVPHFCVDLLLTLIRVLLIPLAEWPRVSYS